MHDTASTNNTNLTVVDALDTIVATPHVHANNNNNNNNNNNVNNITDEAAMPDPDTRRRLMLEATIKRLGASTDKLSEEK